MEVNVYNKRYIQYRAREIVRDGTKKFLRELGMRIEFEKFIKGDGILFLSLKSGTKDIGKINLNQVKVRSQEIWQTESVPGLPRYLRGTGIGLYMYEELIKRGLKLSLRVTSSNYASRNNDSNLIWEKIPLMYRVRKVAGRYYILGLRDTEYSKIRKAD